MMHRDPSPRSRPAAAAVELVVAAIILLPLIRGAWEVGRLVQVQQLLNNAVREGARQAAAGNVSADQVKQDVVTYLGANGVTCQKSDVTFTDLSNTGTTDPTGAAQLDHLRVQVSIPFDNVRWIMLTKVTTVTTLTATADWWSINDLPISVQTNIPLY